MGYTNGLRYLRRAFEVALEGLIYLERTTFYCQVIYYNLVSLTSILICNKVRENLMNVNNSSCVCVYFSVPLFR
ncbi:UNVERIFIED_CONTAM: hypothetical protein NCL1_38539 [Trichonephila clavipes]